MRFRPNVVFDPRRDHFRRHRLQHTLELDAERISRLDKWRWVGLAADAVAERSLERTHRTLETAPSQLGTTRQGRSTLWRYPKGDDSISHARNRK
jgi:hypothetical protein